MQLPLEIEDPDGPSAALPQELGRTFRDSRSQPVHGWYSYVEGYSADYLVATLAELDGDVGTLYDPFGGTGSALVEASKRGLPSYYAEANPFMAFVIDAKVNASVWARQHVEATRTALASFCLELRSDAFAKRSAQVDLTDYSAAFPGRDFFDERHLRDLVAAIELAREQHEPRLVDLAVLACASNIVSSSHMTRRADLRRRRDDEYKTRRVAVGPSIVSSVNQILADLDRLPTALASTEQVAGDCRTLSSQWDGFFDVAITSPPYLNGTNYVRNTKLELFLLGFIEHELELGGLRDAGVTGGITQAATSKPIAQRFDVVEAVAGELDACARDKRIPHLVRQYFSDMYAVLQSVHASLRDGGKFVLDIGDSRFYGVHVPTHELLAELARRVGFAVERERLLARRHSRDKTPLVQVDLCLAK